MQAIANIISQAFCRHHDIIKVEGNTLRVACMKCGKGSAGIVTG